MTGRRFRKRFLFYIILIFFVTFVTPIIYVGMFNEKVFSSEQNKELIAFKEKEYKIITSLGVVKYKAYVWVYQLSDESDVNYDTYEIVMRLQRIYVADGCNTIEMYINVTNKIYPFDNNHELPYAFVIDESPNQGVYDQIGEISIIPSDPKAVSLTVSLFEVRVSTEYSENMHSFGLSKLPGGISAIGPNRSIELKVLFKYPDLLHDKLQSSSYTKIDGQIDTIFHIEGIMVNQNDKTHYVGQFTIVCSLRDLV